MNIKCFRVPLIYRGVEIMIIERVTTGGFRNIKRVDLEFDGMLALVSPNSYGKSNLIKAIEFGIDFIDNTQETKRRMMSWFGGVPLNKQMDSDDFFIEFEMTTKVSKIEYKILYGFQFRWLRNDKTGARIVEEWLKVKINDKNQKYNNYIMRTDEKALYRTSETGRCSNKISIESDELIINKLKAYDFLFYSEIIKRVNNLSMYIERHLDASSSYTFDPFVRTDKDVLQIEDGMNIPRVIFYLKKQFPDKYEMLLESFMLLFPTVTDILVDELEIKEKNIVAEIPDDVPLRIDNQFYTLRVVDSNLNQPVSFERISDGAKRVFLILTSIILADINGFSLIAIEEPENSIHPSLLQKYLRVLSQLIVNCKIIITSHSPYVIQYLEPHNLYIGIPCHTGLAKFSRIRQSAQKTIINDSSKLGMSTGDYIFDLLSGADEDLLSLQRYLEEKTNG